MENSQGNKQKNSLEQIFFYIENIYFNLYSRLKLYKQLYISGKSNVELLNKTAPAFFRHVQVGFHENILMAVRRLVDKEQLYGDDNLSLLYLLKQIQGDDNYSNIASKIKSMIDEIIEIANNLKQQVNKTVAHSDLKTVLGMNKIQTATFKDVEEILGILFELIQLININIFNAEIFDDVSMRGDACRLLTKLREIDNIN